MMDGWMDEQTNTYHFFQRCAPICGVGPPAVSCSSTGCVLTSRYPWHLGGHDISAEWMLIGIWGCSAGDQGAHKDLPYKMWHR